MKNISSSLKKIKSDLGAAASEVGSQLRDGAANVRAAASMASEPLDHLKENLGRAKTQIDLSVAFFKDDMQQVAGTVGDVIVETSADIADTAQNATLLVAGSVKDIKGTVMESSTAAALRKKADTLRTKAAGVVGKADELVEEGATKLSRGLAGLRSKLAPTQG